MALARVEECARAVMEADSDLTAAKCKVDDAQAAASDKELLDRRAAAESSLAETRQAQEQLEDEMQAPEEPDRAKSDAASLGADHAQAEPTPVGQARYSTPFGWLAWLELPILYIVARGEFGFTYLASRVTLMPGMYLADFTRAMVAATLAGGVFSGRWFRWRVASRGNERTERRWHFLAPAVAIISALLVAVTTARMRDAYLRSTYQVAAGRTHQFVMQTSFIPWLTVLGVALVGLAFSLSYMCGSSPVYRDVWQRSAAWFKHSRSERNERNAAQETRLQAEQARAARREVVSSRVAEAEAAVAEVKAEADSIKAAEMGAKELEDQCWKRLAGLVPGLLLAEQVVVTSYQVQVASGNATSRTLSQKLLQQNARQERGAPDRFRDWWRGTNPSAPELRDPPPTIEEVAPETVIAWARAIAAPAERALIKHGLLDPDDLPPTNRRPSLEPRGHTTTPNRPGPKGHTGSPNGQPPAVTTMEGGSA
jgi:hypothetical protein